jgi:hypothetical protein
VTGHTAVSTTTWATRPSPDWPLRVGRVAPDDDHPLETIADTI